MPTEPLQVDFNALVESAKKRRSTLDAEYEQLGYKRIGGKYLKIDTPTDRLKSEIGLQQSTLNLQKTKQDLAKSDDPLDELLSPTEVGALGLNYGVTKRQAIGKKPMTTDERNKTTQSSKAKGILDQIEKYSDKVNTFDAGFAGSNRALRGLLNLFGAKTQTNKNATLLKQQSGKLSNLIRALGEVGTLAEGDVQRGIQLIPDVSDTKEIAKAKITDLRELLSAGSSQDNETGKTDQKLDPGGYR